MSLALKLFCVFFFFQCLSSFIFCSLLSWLQAFFKFLPSKVKNLMNIYLSAYLSTYQPTYPCIVPIYLQIHRHTYMKTCSLHGIQIYMSSVLSPYFYNNFPNNIWQGVSPLEKKEWGWEISGNLMINGFSFPSGLNICIISVSVCLLKEAKTYWPKEARKEMGIHIIRKHYVSGKEKIFRFNW